MDAARQQELPVLSTSTSLGDAPTGPDLQLQAVISDLVFDSSLLYS